MSSSTTVFKAVAAAALISLSVPSVTNAATFFKVDSNPSGTKLFLDPAKGAGSSFGTVLSNDDVAISVVGNADFASGFSTIKPVKKGTFSLLLFTPVNAGAFNAFSFRGQDILAGQVITVTVQDNQGHAPETFSFTEGVANQDFARNGIIAALQNETIKWVRIQNLGGFKEAKQFEFGLIDGAKAPEPATWAMMLLGLASLGAALRSRRGAPSVVE